MKVLFTGETEGLSGLGLKNSRKATGKQDTDDVRISALASSHFSKPKGFGRDLRYLEDSSCTFDNKGVEIPVFFGVWL